MTIHEVKAGGGGGPTMSGLMKPTALLGTLGRLILWMCHRFFDRSRPTTPTKVAKRLRSVTPSDAGSEPDDSLRSPLAKRRKIVADRSGMSKLKEAISVNDPQSRPDTPMSPRSVASADSDDSDDFLAREMGD